MEQITFCLSNISTSLIDPHTRSIKAHTEKYWNLPQFLYKVPHLQMLVLLTVLF